MSNREYKAGSPGAQVATLCHVLTGESDPVMDFRCVDERADAKAEVAAWRKLPKDERGAMRFNFRGKPSVVFPKLDAKNKDGFAIYYSVNRTDGEGRKRANMVKARALAIDLDGEPLPEAWKIKPHLILESSPGKFQCLWAINETDDFDAHRDVMMRLALHYGGDPSVCDITRVLRVPGFLHQKAKPFRSRIVYAVDPAELDFGGRLDLDAFDWLPPLPERERTDSDGAAAITCEQLAAFFDALPADRFGRGKGNYNDWLKIGMAAHKATNGEGLAEWLAWCRTSNPEYDDDDSQTEAEDKWEGFDAARADGVGIGALRFEAEKCGVSKDTLRGIFDTHTPKSALDAFGDDFGAFLSDDEEDPLESATDDKGVMSFNGLKAQLLSSVQSENIEWLWHKRLPRGKVVLIAGFPDMGKSQVVLSICAKITNGDAWPNNEGRAEHGSVIYLSAEDTAADVIKPRFLANGGDPERFLHLKNEVASKRGAHTFNIADDLKKLTGAVEHMRSIGRPVKAVVLDPINAYFGGKDKADSFKTSDMRAMLTPLNDWAEEMDVIIIGITHFKKGADANMLYRIVDSMAISAASRAAWVCGKIGEGDNAKNVFAQLKRNLGEAPSLEYSFEEMKEVDTDSKGNPINAPRITWGGVVDVMAEALAGAKGEREKRMNGRDYAVTWLENYLAEGPRLADDVNAEAKAQGHGRYALMMAKNDLDIEAERQGFGKDGEWWWLLPGQKMPKKPTAESDFG